jgi:hypothetical protein
MHMSFTYIYVFLNDINQTYQGEVLYNSKTVQSLLEVTFVLSHLNEDEEAENWKIAYNDIYQGEVLYNIKTVRTYIWSVLTIQNVSLYIYTRIAARTVILRLYSRYLKYLLFFHI